MNAEKEKLQSCKLQVAPKIPSTAYSRADFDPKRNPQLSLYIRFFFCVCATLWVGSFFYFIILYIIYKYIYIYNNIYTIYRYTITRTDTKQKTHTHKSCGLRFGTKSCPQHTVGPISGATRNPKLCNFGCVFTFRRSPANAFTFHSKRLRVFRPTNPPSAASKRGLPLLRI